MTTAEGDAAAAAAAGDQQTTYEKVLHVSMNQDASLFALGTTFGFHVYSVHPLKRRFHRDWGSAVGIIELYETTNIVFIVGSNVASRFSTRKLVAWDDQANRVIVDIDFYDDIVAVRVRHDRIVVAVSDAIHILDFKNLSFIGRCEAKMQPNCLAISQTSVNPIIVFSRDTDKDGALGGILAVKGIKKQASKDKEESEDDDLNMFKAHDGKLVCLAVSRDGTRCATASERGTLVRVWNTATGEMDVKLRRGSGNACITTMCFSNDNTLLAVVSDHGTIHIFDLTVKSQQASWYHGILDAVGYDSGGIASIIQIAGPSEPCVMAFSEDKNNLFIVSKDGTYRNIELTYAPPSSSLNSEYGVFNLLTGASGK